MRIYLLYMALKILRNHIFGVKMSTLIFCIYKKRTSIAYATKYVIK